MIRALVIALAALAVAVPAAQAQNAPPGNSGIDEYVEAVPSTTGSKPTNMSSGDKNGNVLTAAQRKALEAEGADGKAAAELVHRFGTPGTGKAHEQRSAAGKKGGDDQPAGAAGAGSNRSGGPGSSVASSLSKAVLPGSDSGGLGPALPAILIAITAAGAGVALLRRFRAS